MQLLFKPLAVLILTSLALVGCDKKQPPMQMPPPEVGVIAVARQNVPITTELPGRIDPWRVAQVRARATGILLKRTFVEGSEVKAGDVLFEIDAAPLEASHNSTKANLLRAQAGLKQIQSRIDRYKSLVEINAISKQDYDDAQATLLQAQADVTAHKAAVEASSLNLGYTKVTAPISGKIGKALVTEGALVSQAEATQLAVIQQLDPVYFDFTQSSIEVLKLKSAFDQGHLQKVAEGEAKVTLILEDGTKYPHEGKLLFSDTTVDPTTGMVTLRAEFPNPDYWLLPGMFARVQLSQAVDKDAITVLQRAVALGANGAATVMVVGVGNKIEARTIKLGRAVEDKWIVLEGLKAGETIVVEGLQKIRPGAEVKTVPFTAA